MITALLVSMTITLAALILYCFVLARRLESAEARLDRLEGRTTGARRKRAAGPPPPPAPPAYRGVNYLVSLFEPEAAAPVLLLDPLEIPAPRSAFAHLNAEHVPMAWAR